MDFWITLQSHKWGHAIWFLLYFLCVFLLFKYREEWGKRIDKVLVYSAMVLLLFFNPIFASVVMEHFLPGYMEYERTTWLFFPIPIMAFVFVKIAFLLDKKKRIRLIIVFFIMCLVFGETTFISRDFQKPDNAYKLSNDVIEISDAITEDSRCYVQDEYLLGSRAVSKDEDEHLIKPTVLVQMEKDYDYWGDKMYHGIRQYTSAPVLTPVVISPEKYQSPNFDLLNYGIMNYEYFVCDNVEQLTSQAEKYGFELLTETDNYALYKNMKEATIYFVRHGQTDANVDKLFVGSGTDSKLTNEGNKQGRMVGDALENIHFDEVYTSKLSRAQNTAKNILSKNKNEVPDSVQLATLNDINWGKIEGMTYEEILEKYPDYNGDSYIGTISDSKFVSPIGATTKYKLVNNFKTALNQIVANASEYGNVLVVGHSSFVWLLQQLFPKQVNASASLDNATITVIHYNHGKWELECFNEIPSEYESRE